MMHAAYANASPFTDGLSAARSDAPVLHLEEAARPVRVSALGETALSETMSEMVAMSTTPSFGGSSQNMESSLYSSDIASMALGLIGAWLVVVGVAMLARHVRLVRIEQTQL